MPWDALEKARFNLDVIDPIEANSRSRLSQRVLRVGVMASITVTGSAPSVGATTQFRATANLSMARLKT